MNRNTPDSLKTLDPRLDLLLEKGLSKNHELAAKQRRLIELLRKDSKLKPPTDSKG